MCNRKTVLMPLDIIREEFGIELYEMVKCHNLSPQQYTIEDEII
jgi:hypothetical protein